MPYILDAACLCNTGKVRKNNEDNFYFDGQRLEEDNKGLEHPVTMRKTLRREVCVAVFDGMGGENFGECASFAAADCMQKTTRKWKDFFIPEREFLNSMCLRINDAVVAKQQELCTERMGSTMAALYFSHGYVYACNLGDSRAYRLRDGELLQLSEDHIEKREGKRKAPLTQHLGISPENFLIEPYIAKSELKQGDQYLLCSDGLTDMLTDREIAEILSASKTPEESVRQLIDTALKKGGKDNVTAIVCQLLGNGTSLKESLFSGGNKVAMSAILAGFLLLLIVYLTVHIWTPGNCTESAVCKICGKTRGEPLGHAWSEWEELEAASCDTEGRARRICLNDPSHTEGQTLPPTGHSWSEATCTEPAVCQNCGETNGTALGHNWGESNYSWSSDKADCTAARVCTLCGEAESETVQTSYIVTKQANCTGGEIRVYLASFENPAFSEQSESVEGAALGHVCLRVGPQKRCLRCGAIFERPESDAHGSNRPEKHG